MRPATAIQRIGLFLILATTFSIPLFFLPITSEFYEFNKNSLLFFSSLLLLIVLGLSYVVERQVRIIRSPFGLPILAILLSWILSTVLRSPNRFDALVDPGQTGTILALGVFFFVAVNFIRSKRDLEMLGGTIIASLGVLGLITILWSSGLAPQLIADGYLKSNMWTPIGNPLLTITMLVAGLPFLVTLLAREGGLNLKSGLISLVLLLQVGGSAMLGLRLLQPENRPVFLAQQTSWAIALEAVKISPLLGTGPATFLSDFTRFRPISYNLTPTWAVRFTNSNNFYLQLLATTGLLGIISYVFLVYRALSVFSKTAKSIHSPESPTARIWSLAGISSAVLLFASQLFIPVSAATLFLTFVFLVITVAALKLAGSSLVSEANVDIVAATSTGHHSPLLPWIALAIALLFAVPGLYLGSRVYYGEMLFQKALVSAAANEGKATYDTLLSAMRVNPFRDSYRLVYSQTNLLLANSIAGNAQLSDSDRTTVTQLIQQAIREAKNAVALNTGKVSNVENLASVYRNLLNLAEGADDWTVASYRQAILLDPVNPNLRISMGGVLYALERYDEAAIFFQQAVDLKPNLANAHYNLASAHRKKGDLERALASMQNVLQLVDRNGPDYEAASKELAELQDEVGQQTPAAPAVPEEPVTLTTPAPLPTPIATPIQLDESLSPEVTPTPQP